MTIIQSLQVFCESPMTELVSLLEFNHSLEERIVLHLASALAARFVLFNH
ncbi:MAG TPA: hypothetical protein PKD12_22575 [Nitrospira sp.]|nr:hypothetical protein [Nitrospira sp.]